MHDAASKDKRRDDARHAKTYAAMQNKNKSLEINTQFDKNATTGQKQTALGAWQHQALSTLIFRKWE